MKNIKVNKLSKRKRIISLVVVGLVILSLGWVISAQVFQKNTEVYQPEVVSNYQPEEEKR
jgi:hypothetical protein